MAFTFSPDVCVGFVSKSANNTLYTVTTMLGYLLTEAEKRYGPRDINWTVLGAEFFDDIPRIWFPNDTSHIAIQLTDSARFDINEAMFQLSHETIHLLAPVKGAANVLEEGIATLFADEMSAQHQWGKHAGHASYVNAKRAVEALLNLSPNAISLLRAHEPSFSKMTDTFIRAHIPNCSAIHASELAKTFIR
jgi:hypothetical protein